MVLEIHVDSSLETTSDTELVDRSYHCANENENANANANANAIRLSYVCEAINNWPLV